MPTKILDCRMYARTPCPSQYRTPVPELLQTYHIPHNADSIARRQTSQTHGQASSHVHEAGEQRVILSWRRPYVVRDEDGYYEGVDR